MYKLKYFHLTIISPGRLASYCTIKENDLNKNDFTFKSADSEGDCVI